MRFRSIVVALVGVLALTLSACASEVDGTATAARGLGGAGQNGSGGMPSELGDLGDLLGQSGGDGDSGTPSDLDDALGGLGALLGGAAGDGDSSNGDTPNVDDLSKALGQGMGGLGAMLGMSPECTAAFNLTTSFGMLFLGQMLGSGSSVTQDDVDKAFANAGELPPELQNDAKVLHEAASKAVGKSMAETNKIMDSDKVSAATDHLENYLDDHCDPDDN